MYSNEESQPGTVRSRRDPSERVPDRTGASSLARSAGLGNRAVANALGPSNRSSSSLPVVLALQRSAGNRAVTTLLQESRRPPGDSSATGPVLLQRPRPDPDAEPVRVPSLVGNRVATQSVQRGRGFDGAGGGRAVQRWGDLSSGDSWGERALDRYRPSVAKPKPGAATSAPSMTVQRDPLLDLRADRLNFSDRPFSPPETDPCPSCHRVPRGTPFEMFADREATQDRLVDWAEERGLNALKTDYGLRKLQLQPGSEGDLVDEVSTRLVWSILHSREFEGSEESRRRGATMLRERWGEVQDRVRPELEGWFRQEYVQAVARSPWRAGLVFRPDVVRRLVYDPYTRPGDEYDVPGPLGVVQAAVRVGDEIGELVLVDFSSRYDLWFHLEGRPQWYYQMSAADFARSRPFLTSVATQTYDRTDFVRWLWPALVRVLGFTAGLKSRIGFVIAGIVLDEISEEMVRDLGAQDRRSALEILQSAGMQLLVDRIASRLFSRASRPANTRLARVAHALGDRAAPAVRREIVTYEYPLVMAALRDGGARPVTDPALVAKGYIAEIGIVTEGQRHIYRLGRNGKWCRFCTPICGLELPEDIARIARETGSLTGRQLGEASERHSDLVLERSLLDRLIALRRTQGSGGRVDLSSFTPAERDLLEHYAEGNAANLTLQELRRRLREAVPTGPQISNSWNEVVRLYRQWLREGIPLYQAIRRATPSGHARNEVMRRAKVNRDGRAMVIDQVSRQPPPPGEALECEHIVSVREIVDMPGFRDLRPEDQLAIANDIDIMIAMRGPANASRQNKRWAAWPNAEAFYSREAINRMIRIEAEKRAYIAGRIAAFSSR